MAAWSSVLAGPTNASGPRLERLGPITFAYIDICVLLSVAALLTNSINLLLRESATHGVIIGYGLSYQWQETGSTWNTRLPWDGARGVATGGIAVYIPPKSLYLTNFYVVTCCFFPL